MQTTLKRTHRSRSLQLLWNRIVVRVEAHRLEHAQEGGLSEAEHLLAGEQRGEEAQERRGGGLLARRVAQRLDALEHAHPEALGARVVERHVVVALLRYCQLELGPRLALAHRVRHRVHVAAARARRAHRPVEAHRLVADWEQVVLVVVAPHLRL